MPTSSVLPSAVYGKNIVTTSNSLAVNAGMEVLINGGNAVDSALAAATCLTVVEPTMNGLGGDMMALVWDAGRVHALEGVGWSPRCWDGLPAPKTLRGWGTVTVPGQVRGWAALHKKFGSQNWNQLFDRALKYAQDGFVVSSKTAALWNTLPADLTNQPGFKEEFLNSGAPEVGEFYQPQSIGRSLKLIAESYGEDFYTGQIAKEIVSQANVAGHAWTVSDLSEWEPRWTESVTSDFNGATLHEMPPPSQGGACSLALALYDICRSRFSSQSEAQQVHLEIECMKYAIHFTQPFCADTQSSGVEISNLLSERSVASIASMIDPLKASSPGRVGHQSGGTVLIVTADSRGQVCVLIQSNFYGFGSGVVIPGFGVSLHNRGVGFAMNASPQNSMAGRKKPFHIGTSDGH